MRKSTRELIHVGDLVKISLPASSILSDKVARVIKLTFHQPTTAHSGVVAIIEFEDFYNHNIPPHLQEVLNPENKPYYELVQYTLNAEHLKFEREILAHEILGNLIKEKL